MQDTPNLDEALALTSFVLHQNVKSVRNVPLKIITKLTKITYQLSTQDRNTLNSHKYPLIMYRPNALLLFPHIGVYNEKNPIPVKTHDCNISDMIQKDLFTS